MEIDSIGDDQIVIDALITAPFGIGVYTSIISERAAFSMSFISSSDSSVAIK